MKTSHSFFSLSLFAYGGSVSTELQEKVDVIVQLNDEAKTVVSTIPKDIIIAHRGTTYFAPEESEPAYRWARNIGADYLELDLQMTKDGVLVAFHDDDLNRTTNIKSVFPKQRKKGIYDFSLKELRRLDIGTWFNEVYPERANSNFKGLTIMTLKDVIQIAEGNRIKRKNEIPVKEMKNNAWTGHYLYEKDPDDNGNRPGVYVETKHPKFGVEKILAQTFTDMGWNINQNAKQIPNRAGKVNIANSKARVILQSFSPESIVLLEKYLPNIPKCYLLWKPNVLRNKQKWYQEAVEFAVKNNVHIIGPSIAGAPNNYGELTEEWMTNIIHKTGMLIHPYTFDSKRQMRKYVPRVDGIFTNRSDLALEFFEREQGEKSLQQLGY